MPDHPHQQSLFAYDARREHARALRRAGVPVSEIRRRLNLESDYRALSLVADIPPPNPKFRARAKDESRQRARELRLQGRTYTEIASELGVSKSSVSLWCSDLPRPAPRPGKRRGSTWGPRLAKRAADRAEAKAAAAAEVGLLSARELFLVGVALYWAEGTKDKPYARREMVTFINSDPTVITMFLRWLRVVGIPMERCNFRVHIHETANVAAAVAYWAKHVGVDPGEFRKTTIKRHNPKTNRINRGRLYNGCLVITVHQSATLYWRIEGWWRALSAADERVTANGESIG